MVTIEGLVAQARQDGASDIHIICGLPPKYRKDGQIENMCDEVLDERECLRLARDLAGTDEAFKTLMRDGELDAAATFAGSRCRIHIFKQQGVPSVVAMPTTSPRSNFNCRDTWAVMSMRPSAWKVTSP